MSASDEVPEWDLDEDPIWAEKGRTRPEVRKMHYQQHPLSQPQSTSRFLDQTKYWVDRNLERIKIKGMDSDYLMATMVWLLKRSEELKFAQELYRAATTGGVDEKFVVESAHTWIKSTPLFQRLQARYTKLTATAPRKITTNLMEVVE